MSAPPRLEPMIEALAILAAALCGVGAVASLFVVLVRIPAIAVTRLDLLFGTVLGVAVGLLFAIAGLLIHLTWMVRKASRTPALSSGGDTNRSAAGSGPEDERSVPAV